ncbi:MAG: N-acetylmuramoyl-L-alanine amidase, partial [Acidobacteriota bacterium]
MRSFASHRLVPLGIATLMVAGILGAAPPNVSAQSAKQLYTSALGRERTLRDADQKPTLKQLRALAGAYLRLVYRYPTSGYSDNALWQAAGVYALAYERFEQETDRKEAEQALERLRREYPASSLVARRDDILELLSRDPAPARPSKTVAVSPVARPAIENVAAAPAALPVVATLAAIRRTEIGNVVRITLELDSEIAYHEERVDGPDRVFFDLRNVKLGPGLREAPISFRDDVLKQVRLGRRGDGSTRVAMDLRGVSRYSVFTLYNPYRLVVDFERGPSQYLNARGESPGKPTEADEPAPAVTSVPRATAERAPLPVGASPLRVKSVPVSAAPRSTVPKEAATARAADNAKPEPKVEAPLPSEPTKTGDAPVPTPPAANGSGNYSLARQLGLGVARVVIDPGHGGHDPGAHGYGVVEAELVLDVARRLEKMLLKEEGIEVEMTRRTDVFIPLEERTAIANKAGADLFLSIHANASRNSTAQGVETYYLNFASNPEAEEVAARENSASSRTLHVLPDLIKAIALNNKLDESRDFAELVQKS